MDFSVFDDRASAALSKNAIDAQKQSGELLVEADQPGNKRKVIDIRQLPLPHYLCQSTADGQNNLGGTCRFPGGGHAGGEFPTFFLKRARNVRLYKASADLRLTHQLF